MLLEQILPKLVCASSMKGSNLLFIYHRSTFDYSIDSCTSTPFPSILDAERVCAIVGDVCVYELLFQIDATETTCNHLHSSHNADICAVCFIVFSRLSFTDIHIRLLSSYVLRTHIEAINFVFSFVFSLSSVDSSHWKNCHRKRKRVTVVKFQYKNLEKSNLVLNRYRYGHSE